MSFRRATATGTAASSTSTTNRRLRGGSSTPITSRFFRHVAVLPALLATAVITSTTTTCTVAAADNDHDNDNDDGVGVGVVDAVLCYNDAYGPQQDTGCSPDRPICVNDQNQEPPFRNSKNHPPADDAAIAGSGTHCVPCISYTDHPAEPDWGCSPQQPLCSISTSSDNHNHNGLLLKYEEDEEDDDTGATMNQKHNGGRRQQQQRRPPLGHAGDYCAPYPCHNTKHFTTTTTTTNDSRRHHHLNHIDDGCTALQPFCVDGLGNDPPLGGPGMDCVGLSSSLEEGEVEEDLPTKTTTGIWGFGRSTFWGSSGRRSNCNRRHREAPAAAADPTSSLTSTSTAMMMPGKSFDLVSLCTGCPLSGQGRTCEATKSCDTLGGAAPLPKW